MSDETTGDATTAGGVGEDANPSHRAIIDGFNRVLGVFRSEPTVTYGIHMAHDAVREHVEALARRLAAAEGANAKLREVRTLDEWHEDAGPVVWWKFPVDEPSYIGTPLDTDWPGYHTHWTPHPEVPGEKCDACGGTGWIDIGEFHGSDACRKCEGNGRLALAANATPANTAIADPAATLNLEEIRNLIGRERDKHKPGPTTYALNNVWDAAKALAAKGEGRT